MKKSFSQHHKYVVGTGGGAYVPPPNPKSEEEQILAKTISFSIQGLKNSFDSDGVAGMYRSYLKKCYAFCFKKIHLIYMAVYMIFYIFKVHQEYLMKILKLKKFKLIK